MREYIGGGEDQVARGRQDKVKVGVLMDMEMIYIVIFLSNESFPMAKNYITTFFTSLLT